MPKRKSADRNRNPEIGMLLNKAGDNAQTQTWQDYSRSEVPGGDTSSASSQNEAFKKARLVARTNYWLREFLRAKVAVWNYGIAFSGGDDASREKKKAKSKPAKTAKGKTAADADPLTAWLDESAPVASATVDENDAKQVGIAGGAEISNRERLMKFIEDCWLEVLLLDNVIAAWENDNKFAYVLPLESCRYKDVLGIETLFYRHGLTEQERKLLPPAQQERYGEAEILFDPKQGEYFRVLKNERTGSGLSWPSVQSIFRALSTMESMEIGEAAYAYSGKMKYRHHKVGHEIKQGPMAGKPSHFWTKKRGDSIRNIFENKIGFLGDYISNFDHSLEYPHEDEKYYDEKKWQSPEHRLIAWGGALAQMLFATGVRPNISQLLRAEVTQARLRMGLFLESVINQAFVPPAPVKIIWSNTIFNDSRIAAEDRKFGVTCGALSQSTWREEAGFNDAQEQKRKEAEAEEFAGNPQKFWPAFDAAHGGASDKGGSPQGGVHGDNLSQS